MLEIYDLQTVKIYHKIHKIYGPQLELNTSCRISNCHEQNDRQRCWTDSKTHEHSISVPHF